MSFGGSRRAAAVEWLLENANAKETADAVRHGTAYRLAARDRSQPRQSAVWYFFCLCII